MDIAYIVGGLWRHHPGLHSKVLGAAKVWEKQGAKVTIVLFSEGRILDANGATLSLVPAATASQLEAYYDTKRNKLSRFLSLRYQYAFLKETIVRLAPDVVYTRYALPFPGVERAFGSVCPYIVEINSDDLVEYGLKSKITGLYNRLFRKSFLGHAKGLCFISHEMSVSSSFNWYKGKTAVIANSISCDKYPFNAETGNDQVNICFIGSPKQSWHGLDKIDTLCSRYPEWIFHIIGPDRKEYLVTREAAPDNVVFHGYLSGDEAKQLLMKMDVGISTLALHRKKIHEASPLKSRQYLAQGIPFISAYDDTDIKNIECVYQLPNTEMNVANNLDLIGDFVYKVYRNIALREDARKYAEKEIDSYIVENKRLEFIKSCV
jgi:glycosyltransferase involved in cell wall biosynthesis